MMADPKESKDKHPHASSVSGGGHIKDARQAAALRAEELLKQSSGKATPSPSKDDHIEVSRAEYEKLKEQFKEWTELRDRLLRQAADFENAKKRLQREKEEFVRFAHEELISALLPAIQNLDRVVHHGEKGTDGPKDPLVAGVELVIKQMHEALHDRGVRRIESVGKLFNPHLHEAVAHVVSDKPVETIIEETQPGYLLHDKLIQPAKVIVSKGLEGENQQPGHPEGPH